MKPNVRYLIAISSFCFLGVGCADTNTSKQPTTKPLTADQKQAAILADPMGYGANGTSGKNLPDARPTLKGDLDNFFDP